MVTVYAVALSATTVAELTVGMIETAGGLLPKVAAGAQKTTVTTIPKPAILPQPPAVRDLCMAVRLSDRCSPPGMFNGLGSTVIRPSVAR
jgi:hypothetical protein